MAAFLGKNYEAYDDYKRFCRQSAPEVRKYILLCFGRLNCKGKLPIDLFTLIDINILTDDESSADVYESNIHSLSDCGAVQTCFSDSHLEHSHSQSH